jgi:dTDP-4-amino-4,6-dideoxygalactose transaminase
MLGFNYRMTEIEAAITREQLKKLPKLVEDRQENIRYLEEHLKNIPCLKMPKVRKNCTHAYYVHAILFDEKTAGISRNQFVEALKAELMPIARRETEGINVGCGYTRPLYLQPMYQNKIAFGSKGYPWSMSGIKYDYTKVICPVTEDLHYRTLITHEYMRPGMTKKDLDDVITAFSKVWEGRHEIR